MMAPMRRRLFQRHRHADGAASADHQILPRAYGFPIKIRIPTKLGFKNSKYVTAMWVQNKTPGYWESQGYNWFSGL